eukprot:Skav233971  [mRNA]  locus=scaffold1008:609355:620104:- [translate_table: standard]
MLRHGTSRLRVRDPRSSRGQAWQHAIITQMPSDLHVDIRWVMIQLPRRMNGPDVFQLVGGKDAKGRLLLCMLSFGKALGGEGVMAREPLFGLVLSHLPHFLECGVVFAEFQGGRSLDPRRARAAQLGLPQEARGVPGGVTLSEIHDDLTDPIRF